MIISRDDKVRQFLSKVARSSSEFSGMIRLSAFENQRSAREIPRNFKLFFTTYTQLKLDIGVRLFSQSILRLVAVSQAQSKPSTALHNYRKRTTRWQA